MDIDKFEMRIILSIYDVVEIEGQETGNMAKFINRVREEIVKYGDETAK